ncbi:ANK REP REGION domain-containing protein [Citrus sinensis]|uniref:ANK REP REGION domain-containing protein n=1 Tax=Citrus sinensis TaxID=2711 RepID=A0ACB8I2S2_CITSI|nr:ANK REP REGION domain-containing protein [Citrus sinensis]
MDSIISIEFEEAPSLGSKAANQSQTGPKLLKAAADGNAEPFKDMAREVIESLLTLQTRNTILHVNIICQETENASTKFVEEILEICPALLIQVNAKGDTPLHVAAKFRHSDIVRVLIDRANLAQHGDEEPESGVEDARQMIRMVNNKKNTALHDAMFPGNMEVVKILTKEDPDYPYSANDYGKTPLYIAAESESSDMVLTLLENCTSLSHEGPNGKTALHAAAMHFDLKGDHHAMRQLFERKKSLLKVTDQYGWTPIHYAAYHGKYWINALLEIDQTATNIADKDRKMTALHLAAGRGHARTVETILSLAPECFELVDNRGWNFLHYAVVSFEFPHLKTLLGNPLARILINEGDAKGNTSLHVLAAVRPNEFNRYMTRTSHANYMTRTTHAVNDQNVSVGHIMKYGYPELLVINLSILSTYKSRFLFHYLFFYAVN